MPSRSPVKIKRDCQAIPTKSSMSMFFLLMMRGDEIQASCSPKIAKWFRHPLCIGNIVTVANFSVVVNVRSYRYVTSRYNMKLSAKTVIKKYSGSVVHIPTFSYNFFLFETLTTQSLSNKQLLDDATIVEQAKMSRFEHVFEEFNGVLRLSTTTETIMAINYAISVYQEFDDAYMVVLDIIDGIENTSFMLFEFIALRLFKFLVSKYKNGDDCYTILVFMAHQVENMEKVFHVKFVNNDGRLVEVVLFIIINIIDIEGVGSSGDEENIKMQKNEDVSGEYEEQRHIKLKMLSLA
ncbi:hypothetical protein ACFE04_001823 [Oxalis oulophora]